MKKLERHGPGSDRLSAMKAAFRSQYNSQVNSISKTDRFARKSSGKEYVILSLTIVQGIVGSHVGTNYYASFCNHAPAATRTAETKYGATAESGERNFASGGREEKSEKKSMGIIGRLRNYDYFVYTAILR